MRRVKAEGGWAVVCTEQVEIHPTSDITPFIELRIWDDKDLPALARIADGDPRGRRAGRDRAGPQRPERAEPVQPGDPARARITCRWPRYGYHPVQARMMSKQDIADLRRWHRNAVARSMTAGYDLVYVYAGHSLRRHRVLPVAELQPARRRVRRKRPQPDAAAARDPARTRWKSPTAAVAVACRISVDEGLAGAGISRGHIEEILGELGELPDLWDFVMGSWDADSTTSRFGPEGEQEKYVAGLKTLTSKPVVGVGRFTSPDLMVRQVKIGILDLIGAARPSIADPFLPEKIRDRQAGDDPRVHRLQRVRLRRLHDVADPVHPEPEHGRGVPPRLASRSGSGPRGSDARILVVGSGPAGLEAARALGRARLRRRAGGSRRATSAAASPGRRGCPAWPPGSGCWTTGSRRSRPCPTSRSTARAG